MMGERSSAVHRTSQGQPYILAKTGVAHTSFPYALPSERQVKKLAEKKRLTLEEKRELVKDLRPIDDIFFEVLADDIPTCQEMLRVLLDDPKLIVKEVIVQSSKRNLYGRSIRLDALCFLGDGTLCNIEVQRGEEDHVKRTRYTAATLTVKHSEPGDKFRDLATVYIVYISESDIFGYGYPVYHMKHILEETGTEVDDGCHILFANTECQDGSDKAELLSCFREKSVENPKFPVLSKRMKELKESKGGLQAMSSVLQKYEEAARKEGFVKGRTEERLIAIRSMIKHGFPREKIEQIYPKEDIEKAIEQMKNEQ